MEHEHSSNELFDSHNVFGTSPRKEWKFASPPPRARVVPYPAPIVIVIVLACALLCGSYVVNAAVGTADGRALDGKDRKGWRLADFVFHPRSREAGLTEEEVIGVRLCTRHAARP